VVSERGNAEILEVVHPRNNPPDGIIYANVHIVGGGVGKNTVERT